MSTDKISTSSWYMITYSLLSLGIPLLIHSYGLNQPILYSSEKFNLTQVAVGTPAIQTLLFIYALLPLLLVPAVISIYYYFKDTDKFLMRIGMSFAQIGISALVISLLLLPTLNWIVLPFMQNKVVDAQPMFILFFQAINSYFSIGVGDILGLGSLFIWLVITSCVMLKSEIYPVFLGIINLIIALSALAVLILRITNTLPTAHQVVQLPVLLSVWSLIVGISLMVLTSD
jgi:hypothetical protein